MVKYFFLMHTISKQSYLFKKLYSIYFTIVIFTFSCKLSDNKPILPRKIFVGSSFFTAKCTIFTVYVGLAISVAHECIEQLNEQFLFVTTRFFDKNTKCPQNINSGKTIISKTNIYSKPTYSNLEFVILVVNSAQRTVFRILLRNRHACIRQLVLFFRKSIVVFSKFIFSSNKSCNKDRRRFCETIIKQTRVFTN